MKKVSPLVRAADLPGDVVLGHHGAVLLCGCRTVVIEPVIDCSNSGGTQPLVGSACAPSAVLWKAKRTVRTRSAVSESPEPKPTPTVGELLCFDLYSTSRAITGFYRPMLERTGLTYPQFLVLTLLWERDSQPIGALAQRLDLEYNTVSPLVKRMEKAGLVARVANPADERSVLVELTDAGKELRWVSHEMTGKLGVALGMDDAEIALLRKMLHRVRAGVIA